MAIVNLVPSPFYSNYVLRCIYTHISECSHQTKLSIGTADKDEDSVGNVLVDEEREECDSFQSRPVAEVFAELGTVDDVCVYNNVNC